MSTKDDCLGALLKVIAEAAEDRDAGKEVHAEEVRERLSNILEVYMGEHERLVTLRANLGRSTCDHEHSDKLIKAEVTFLNTVGNRLLLARIGSSVKIVGMQLDIEQDADWGAGRAAKSGGAEDGAEQVDIEAWCAERDAKLLGLKAQLEEMLPDAGCIEDCEAAAAANNFKEPWYVSAELAWDSLDEVERMGAYAATQGAVESDNPFGDSEAEFQGWERGRTAAQGVLEAIAELESAEGSKAMDEEDQGDEPQIAQMDADSGSEGEEEAVERDPFLEAQLDGLESASRGALLKRARALELEEDAKGQPAAVVRDMITNEVARRYVALGEARDAQEAVAV